MTETTVKLSCKVLDVKDRSFTISHAQSLLAKEKQMGVANWELTDSKFTLDNGIIKPTNTGANKESGSKGSSAQGNKT